MTKLKTLGGLAAILAGLSWGCSSARADDGEVRLALSNNTVLLKIDGDKDDDWWVEVSTNVTDWTTLSAPGPLLSGNEMNAPWRAVGTRSAGPRYYRARQTAGLYDPWVFRTISLTFTQANWSTALAGGRTSNTNVYSPLMTLNNGATNYSVGARYKGNTSYNAGGTKKSINLELDHVIPNADLMNYSTVNLNNAAGDETIMREPLYFTVMSQYTPCPKGAMARVHINGALWGVYSLIQQENGELIREWFPSNDGDRWRTPNAPAGGFNSSTSAFLLFTGNVWAYTNRYELKSTKTNTLTAYLRLTNAIYVLNATPTNILRDAVEDVFAVDSWLWFLAIENLFVDDDSYWFKGADYGFYYEPESGRMHPIEHDGNEAFAAISGVNYTLSPLQGFNTGTQRPLLTRLLQFNELKQRYLAHLRTVMEEYFNPAVMTPMINRFHSLSVTSIVADPNKNFTMNGYTNDLVALRTYVTNRYNFLRLHAELTPLRPDIHAVNGPATNVYAADTPFVTASVTADGNSGVGTVWLYHRGRSYGKFTRAQMFDDGAHGDGGAGDGQFGASVANYPAGTKVRYYVEARGTNAARAARFSPARAERETYNYRVNLSVAASTPVVINEFMADNGVTLADPQGQYDDWIELRNLTDEAVDLTGRYLSDEPNNPRKWPFPAGTTIPANGYLLVWADENGSHTPGLHASFKLAKDGEQIYLTDTDANLNAVLDSVIFGAQTTDVSYGRSAADAEVWAAMTPTPGAENQ